MTGESLPFQIGQATPTVVASDPSGNFSGNPFAATATATGVGGATVSGNFSFTYYVGSMVSGNGSTTAPSAPGTYAVVASFVSTDQNYVTKPVSSLPVMFVINPLPVVNSPSTVSVNENGSLSFTGANTISLTDAAGSGNNNESLTLSVGAGTLSFGTTTGVNISGSGAGPVTVSGPLASVNTALASLSYTPTPGSTASDTLNLSDEDTVDSATASNSVGITVNAANPALSVKAPVTATVNENASLVFSGGNGNAITVADSNAGSKLEQLTLITTHGTLTLATTKGLTVTSGSNKSASMTVKGTLSNLNAALSGLKFIPTTGYSGSAGLNVTIKDLGSSQTATGTVALTVVVPASTPTAIVKTPFTTVVPGEPVPLVIEVSDTNVGAARRRRRSV